MNIVDLRYLVTAVEAGNFSNAARILHLHPATISRRIARLENDLGLTLFERGRSGVRLTAGASAVVAHARRALAEFDAVQRAGEVNGSGMTGEIRLGVRMPLVGRTANSLITKWRHFQPHVEITIFELNDRDLLIALQERKLDAAIIPSYDVMPYHAALPVCREAIVVALPCGHSLATRESLDWKSLAGETVMVQGWDNSQGQREFFETLLGTSVRFHSHSASKQSVLALVQAGFGLTLATKNQSEIAVPGVVYRPVNEINAWLRLDLAWMPEAEDPALGRFVAFMRDEARSRNPL